MPKSACHLLFIIGLFCIAIFDTFGQSRFGVELDNSKVMALSSRNGIFYLGIDNYIQVSPLFQSQFDSLVILSNNGKVAMEKDNVFFVYPQRTGKIRLMFYGILGNDTASLGYSYFEVREVPKPMLKIDNIVIKSPCALPKKVLQHCDSLTLFFSDDIVGSENWMKIKSFVILYNYGGFIISHDNPSGIFTKETKLILNHLGPNRQIAILPIAEGHGNVIVKLPIYKITLY